MDDYNDPLLRKGTVGDRSAVCGKRLVVLVAKFALSRM